MPAVAPPQAIHEQTLLPAFELTGARDAPAVAVLGGISATRHVATSGTTEGWWSAVAGPGLPLDTTRFGVLGFEYLDGGVAGDGTPGRIVTTHDQADALAALLEAAGIERLHALVGASYGGMVALAFAERYPLKLERLVVFSAPAESHPMTTALRAIQRRIVRLALEAGREREGLALARALAMTTYRSAREFADRFASGPAWVGASDAGFPVERYLDHHGTRFAERWSAARLLALSLSADLHRVDPAGISTPALVVAAEGDTLVPREQLEALVAAIAAPARLAEIRSRTGHDAFLTEPAQAGALLHAALHAPEFP